MSTVATDEISLTRKDFVSDQTVRWCPGCGDYSINRVQFDLLQGATLPQLEACSHVAHTQLQNTATVEVCPPAKQIAPPTPVFVQCAAKHVATADDNIHAR